MFFFYLIEKNIYLSELRIHIEPISKHFILAERNRYITGEGRRKRFVEYAITR
jgi:predicted Rossmann fold nucleotide-binding protein DprA/Smf involved in DNA uptake